MGTPMRVLHCSSGNLYGGIETILGALARRRGANPRMEPEDALCFPGRIRDELRAAGVAVHPCAPARFSRPWTVWKARRDLGRLLAAEPFDAVVCHGCWPHLLFGPVVRRMGRPLVFWMHDTAGGT